MAKFKCSDCNHSWEDTYPIKCPQCGLQDIKEVSSFSLFQKKLWIVIAIIVTCLFLLLVLLPGGDKDIELSLQPSLDGVSIQVKGMSDSQLSNYKIEVYHDGTVLYDQFTFSGKQNHVDYPSSRMLTNTCYTFQFKAKKGDTPKHKWTTGVQYCVPEPPAQPVSEPMLSINTQQQAECSTLSYTVTISVDSVAYFKSITYQIGNTKQSTPIFKNIKPDTYQVVVTSQGGQIGTQQLILQDIQAKDLSMEEVQNEFNLVSNSKKSAGAVHSLLSTGSIKLKKNIGEHKTLFDILIDMEGYGTRYQVVNFKFNPCTGKIISGTLEVKCI